MNKDEVAIVGGSGFVGSHLSNYLKKRDIFFNIYDVDITNEQDVIYIDVEDV